MKIEINSLGQVMDCNNFQYKICKECTYFRSCEKIASNPGKIFVIAMCSTLAIIGSAVILLTEYESILSVFKKLLH